MKKRILITGGAGFVGINAAHYFLGKGFRVTIADDFSRKGSEINASWLRKQFPDEILEIEKVNITTDFIQLSNLVSDADIILHAAAQVAVTDSVFNPVLDFKTNCVGTFNLLEVVRLCGHKPIVLFTSTNKVYGNLADLSVAEKTIRYEFCGLPHGVPEGERLDFYSPYGCSKGAADQYIHDYCRIYGIPTIVFRMSCIYGERQFGTADQGWISWFTIATLFGKKLTIYGNGKQVRDVLCVNDLVRAMDLAVSNISVTKGQVYNIGGGPQNTVSILELVILLEKLLNKKIIYSSGEGRPGDQPIYISDIRKAQKDFGWKPGIGFEKGLEMMINWIKKNKEFVKKTM